MQNDPNCTSTLVMRNIANIPVNVIYIDHSLKDSVDRFVRAERDAELRTTKFKNRESIVKKGASTRRSNVTTVTLKRITSRAIPC